MIGKNITLKNTEVIVEESKVVFHQETSFLIKPYFRENLFINYDIDLSEVPVSILNIPFVANIYPMCWFLGATLKVKSLDKNFFESIEKVKQEFAKFYPEILFRNSKLIVEQLEETHYAPKNKAMLFSGGVDALYTYSRLDNQDVKLITIHGADIEIQNVAQWEKIKNSTKSLELTKSNPYFFIKSNVRRFYRSKTEKLIFNNNQDWWTLIQHGLSLTSLIAPIAYKNNIGEIYIGSTLDTSKDFLPWGSSYIDNYIAWASTQVIHHGQEANRFTKMRLLCDYFQEKKIPTPFRVCYYNKNTKLNCSKCTKCYRAIITLIVLGKDPRSYGFEIETIHGSIEKFYENILIYIRKNVFNQAVYFYWLEIVEEMNAVSNTPFIFSEEVLEIKKYNELKSLLNELKLDKRTRKSQFVEKMGTFRKYWYKSLNKYFV